MPLDTAKLDEHIERLRGGNTLTENEVRALCDQVGFYAVGLAVIAVVSRLWALNGCDFCNRHVFHRNSKRDCCSREEPTD